MPTLEGHEMEFHAKIVCLINPLGHKTVAIYESRSLLEFGSCTHSDVGKNPNQSEVMSSDKMEIACEISPISCTEVI